MKTEKNSKTTLKWFYSIKNKRKFAYTLDAELFIMLTSEFDQTIDRYSKFEYALINNKNHNTIEIAPGLILDSDSGRIFVIFSDILAENPKITQNMCNEIQSRTFLNHCAKLVPTKPSTVTRNNLIDNIEFLYTSALLPSLRPDFSIIKELLEFCEEISIGKLKLKIKNPDSIYQLLFHHALRADLNSALINDETIVTASPIFGSIIKNLK